KKILRITPADSVYPAKRDGSKIICDAAGHVFPASAAIRGAKNQPSIADSHAFVGIKKINGVQRRACPRRKWRPRSSGVGALQNRARISHNETCTGIKENSTVQVAGRSGINRGPLPKNG